MYDYGASYAFLTSACIIEKQHGSVVSYLAEKSVAREAFSNPVADLQLLNTHAKISASVDLATHYWINDMQNISNYRCVVRSVVAVVTNPARTVTKPRYRSAR